MSMYKSNCLVEAVKAKVRTNGKAKIFKVGKWSWIFTHSKFPHFYWVLNGEKYKFNAKYSDEPLLGQIWYMGEIKKY